MVREWVSVNPFPTLLLTEDFTPLSQNAGFAELLEASGSGPREYLLGHAFPDRESGTSPEEYLNNLKDGDCFIKPVILREDRNHILHLTRLSLSSYSCVCCMILPGSDRMDRQLASILNSIECSVAEFDERGNVHYLNSSLKRLLGYSHGTTPPSHLREIEADFAVASLEDHRREVESAGLSRYRTSLLDVNRQVMPVEITVVAGQRPGGRSYLLTARSLADHLTFEKSAPEFPASLHLEEFPETAIPTLRMAWKSPSSRRVKEQVEQVAPTEAGALIVGEPGSGKRVIARKIHALSRRSEGVFITVDCSSLPPELIEQELFGYVPGTFTGVYRDRIGRVPAADGGTLLLKHVDLLPLNLQSRMLRLMEEGRYTLPYAREELSADVRVLCTTIVDLAGEVEKGKFRSDLYRKLAAVQIRVEPLRERPEDIESHIEFFSSLFNRRFGKSVSGVDKPTLRSLKDYHFPGNIRELEHIVERAFIVSSGGSLPIRLPNDNTGQVSKPVLDVFDGRLTEFLSLEEYQRQYIQLVLESTDGKVSGKNGAAEILQIHPQTLFSKMKRLGIKR